MTGKIRIVRTPVYVKYLKRLSASDRQKVEKVENDLKEDLLAGKPFRRGLQVRPLDRYREERTRVAFVTPDLRIIFRIDSHAERRQLVFFTVGSHDELLDRLPEPPRLLKPSPVPKPLPLEIDIRAIALLYECLAPANAANPHFEEQFAHLKDVLLKALLGLKRGFQGQVEGVLLLGEQWLEGVDLGKLPYDGVVLEIMLRTNQRPYDLYKQIAEQVFAGLDRTHFLPQFGLITQAEWEIAQKRDDVAWEAGVPGVKLLGVPDRRLVERA